MYFLIEETYYYLDLDTDKVINRLRGLIFKFFLLIKVIFNVLVEKMSNLVRIKQKIFFQKKYFSLKFKLF